MNKEERELLVERVAFLTALQKKVKEHLDAHAADNLRTQLDDELKNLYVQMGVSKLDLKVNGKKVGTVSARLSKPKVEVVPQVKSVAEFVDWIMTSDSGIDTLTRLVTLYPDKVLECATQDGELPGGCEMVKREVAESWLGTTLRVDADKVADAYQGQLPQRIYGLLGDGGNERI
jgi:hypothetical protein|nr:MAG TPA: hypothetical protein [Caudoviricetes sp.]